MGKFTDQMDAWTRKSEARMEAVAKQSIQTIAERTQEPRAKGGNMPVDTGFLRNSAAAAIGTTPSGNLSSIKSDGIDSGTMQAVEAVIVRLRPGEVFVFGWLANYAQYMEARYAFLRLAAQDWDRIVAESIRTVRQQYDGAL